MRLTSIALAISLFIFSGQVVVAQNTKYKKAYESFKAGEYYKAIDLFKKAYESITDKNEKTKIVFNIGECYRKINEPKEAALWYSKAIKKDFNNPIVYYDYACMLKMLGEYEEAKIQFKAYKELVPGDSRVNEAILSCDLAKEWKEFPTGYTVEEMKFINSKMDDFAPTFARGDYRVLYFTSAREEASGKEESGVKGESFADIFESSLDRKGVWSTPVPLGEQVNSEFDDGTPIMNSDFSRMYFTRCEMSTSKTLGCQIYEIQLKNEEWQKAKVLEIAEDSVVVAHPAISSDELTLYFVSDKEGSIPGPDGKPSKDIWMAKRTSIDKEFDEPVNLGEPVNTPGDEVFPFVHADGTLYFSSNEHGGMGGLDIFKATQSGDGKWIIDNMRYPVNSSADDFGICFEADREAGFFSSSRKGKSDDIYAFALPPLKFTITGVVKNEKTDAPITGASVKAIGSDGITAEATTGNDGGFKFILKPSTDYIFLAKKGNEFLQGKERETTKGAEKSVDFNTVIYLSPTDAPIRIDNIFFDFNSADLRPESMVSLDKLVETLNDNPNASIELSSHTDFRGEDNFNMELSQRRAQSVVNYLISKGIAEGRLLAKGYGESMPKVVDKRDHEAYPFLPEGQVLTEAYIGTIKDTDLQEVTHFLNRRTEFKVLSMSYNVK